ncbi:hypothetical protein [Actinomadura gamaensis]|uniref:Uncharacterized protein n=1 Tax=Actinomadura gamaensis TaxID=1763541 RepID=A0ABV9U321_9ACTN
MTTPPMPPMPGTPPQPGRPVFCSVLTGFFVLRRCERYAAAPCARCGRPACPHHLGHDGRCPECAGHLSRNPYDRSWTHGYRRSHYHHTTTVYGNDGWYSSFDQYDRDSFEPGGGGGGDGGEWAAASGDFGGDEWDGTDTGTDTDTGTGSDDWDSGGDDGLVDS